MSTYVLRRVLLLIPTLLGMSVFIFLMLRLLPGDVVDLMTAGQEQATDESKRKLREAFGLADPLPLQYVKWMLGLLRGDPGKSLRSGQPIADALGQALPVTLELTLLAVLLATTIAIPLGVLSASRRDTSTDFIGRVAGLVGLSVPSFWLATLTLLFTSLVFSWVPPVSWISPTVDPLANLEQMLLPAAALAVQLMAIEMRMTRTTMLEVLGQDYVRTARAKGASERLVTYRHALRNALIPVISVIGFQIGTLMGGSAIIEVIFGLNGIGATLIQAIFNRDYPMVQASALFLATVFVVINTCVDLLYGYLDPRIKHA
ncbi:MAG TPA: ABC transporter permease [Chloroflexota bacterium]|jgi:peptide/nickel transport system permease protein